jgi:hypothetical protein
MAEVCSEGDRATRAKRAILSLLLALGLGVALVLAGPSADARSSYDSAYGFERTWNAALRLVRVDMGLKVTEKDDQSGYLMFEYKSPEGGNKSSSGSMEFVRSREPDAPVRVVVQLPQMPRYHEQVMLDSLVRKMKAEYGDPPPRPKAPAPAPAPPADDAGADVVEAGS